MAGTFQEQVVEHVRCSHAALDAANTAMQKQAAEKKAASDLIPEVVEALVKFDRIDPAQREKAATALADPVNALKILLKTADARNVVNATSIGTPTGHGAPPQQDGRARYVGQRSSEKTAADMAYEKHLRGG